MRARWIAVAAAAMSLLGCKRSHTPVDMTLLEEEARETETQRLASLMALRVEDVAVQKYLEVDTDRLISGKACKLLGLTDEGSECDYPPTMYDYDDTVEPPQCRNEVPNLLARFCTASLAARIADLSGSALEFEINAREFEGDLAPDEVKTYRIPQQSTATKVALLQTSTRAAFEGLAVVERLLTRDSGGPYTLEDYGHSCVDYFEGIGDIYPAQAGCGEMLNSVFGTSDTGGERLLTIWNALQSILIDSGLRAAKLEVSVADSQRGTTSSDIERAERQWSGARLSRGAAAQWLVGGHGVPKATCLRPPASAESSRALGLLRAAGIPPGYVVGNGETPRPEVGEVVNGSVDIPDSVSARLAEQLGRPALSTTDDLPAQFGLTLADFDAARDALAMELLAYDRDKLILVDPNDVDGGIAMPRYLATSRGPTALPAAFYSAHQREFSVPAIFKETEVNPELHVTTPLQLWTLLRPHYFFSPAVVQGDWSVARALASARTVVEGLADGNWGIVPTARVNALVAAAKSELEELVAGVFAVSVTQVVETGTVGAYYMFYNSSAFGFSSSYGVPPYEHALVVRGTSGLRCATEGTIGGEPCRLVNSATGEDDEELVAARLTWQYTFLAGPGYRQEQGSMEEVDWTSIRDEREYLVVPREGLEGEESVLPGQYRVLGGITPTSSLLLNESQWESAAGLSDEQRTFVPRRRESHPLVPALDELAGQILRPSKERCDVPAVSCASIDRTFDSRLALENELSDDLDGVESSWKHYLRLARAAADESDALGEKYVTSTLNVNRREEETSLRREEHRQQTEQLLEELQRACGLDVDPTRLMESVLASMSDTVCSTDAECSAQDLGCFGGRCLKAASSSDAACQRLGELNCAESGRLLACLAGGANVLTALGDKPLCVWRSADNPYSICEGSDVQCPYLAADNSGAWECDESVVPAGADSILVSVTLDLFDSGEAGAPRDGEEARGRCDQLRELLYGVDQGLSMGERMDKRRELQASNFFNPRDMSAAGRDVEFELDYGGTGGLRVHGQVLFSTREEDNLWPCAPTTQADGSPYPTASTFSTTVDCADPAQRTDGTKLLLGGAIAASILAGGEGLDNIDVPTANPWYDSTYDGTSAHSSGFRLERDPVDPSLPISVATDISSGWLGCAETCPDPYGVPIRVYRPSGTDLYSLGGYPDWAQPQLVGAYLSTNARSSSTTQPWFTGHKWDWPDAENFWAGLYDAPNLESLGGPYGPRRADLGEAPYFSWLSDCAVWEDCRTHAELLTDTDTGIVRYTGGYDDLVFEASRRNMFMGAELLCEARSLGASVLGEGDIRDLEPPVIRVEEDLVLAGQYLQAVGNAIEARAGTMVLPEFPVAAADALRAEGSFGAFPAAGGDYGIAVSGLRGALVELATFGPAIGYEIKQLGIDIEETGLAAKAGEIQLQGVYASLSEAESDAVAGCGNALVSGMLGAGSTRNTIGLAGAARQCVQSLGGIQLADQLGTIAQSGEVVAGQLRVAEFRRRFETRVKTLVEYSLGINRALEGIDEHLGSIDSQRLRARRALAAAIRTSSFEPESSENIDELLAATRMTDLRRYDQAREHAIAMSFLARRAIEQRLGINLEDLEEDLSLVSAPSTWESELCSLSGTNWRRIAELQPTAAQGFADAYVGSYVDKLERLVESYRMDYNFHEGTDVAVVSVRDDIIKPVEACDLESSNLLYHSRDMDGAAEIGTAWRSTGCVGDTSSCVSVTSVSDPWPGVGVFGSTLGGPKWRRVAPAPDTWCTPGTDRLCSEAWAQTVDLEPGQYVLSYFSERGLYPVAEMDVRLEDGSPMPFLVGNDAPVLDDRLEAPVKRYYRVFRSDRRQSVSVRVIVAQHETVAGAIAGPMLEQVPSTIDHNDARPSTFSGTGRSRLQTLPLCPSTNPQWFIVSNFARRCTTLCPDGLAGSCSPAEGSKECFWELPLEVDQAALEDGSILSHAGFAKGNFNYRIENVAVNVVGSGVRTCDDSLAPEPCYGSGFLPYSLEHHGPYAVRNYHGNDFDAELFVGRVEYARALAAERYITNPVSTADSDLLAQYTRRELTGRPLNGTFFLRLWETPAIDFDAIEDVQLIIKYRYWTRFD